MTVIRLVLEEYAELCRWVLERDGWKCRNCGSREQLHVHHVVYRSQLGPDEDWNLCTLCSRCHDGIHVDVDDNGNPGLVIETPADARYELKFIWAPGWRPGP